MSIQTSLTRDPIETLAEIVRESGIRPPVDPADFVAAGVVERVGLPRLHLYSHLYTRRLLAIDEQLHAWRAASGAPGSVNGYLPLPSLADALAGLDLERGERMKARMKRFVVLYEDEPA